MHQLTAGARGRLPGDWDFDVYAQYGASSQRKYQTGNVSRSKVEELTFAPDGGVSICGGFNPFGLDSVLPECADYIAVDAGIDADVRQMIAEFSARGAPIELPAGELRMAIGVQYRSDEYQYRADEALRRIHRTAAQTSSALSRPPTSMPTTTTPMCTSRPRSRSSPACRASSRSKPCWDSVIPSMRPPAGWTPGRPSCCISPRRPYACAGPTSARSVSRRYSSCFCLAHGANGSSFDPSRAPSTVTHVTLTQLRSESAAGRGAVHRAGRTGGAAAGLPLGNRRDDSRRQSGSGTGDGRYSYDGHRRAPGIRVALVPRSAVHDRLVPDRDRRRGRRS